VAFDFSPVRHIEMSLLRVGFRLYPVGRGLMIATNDVIRQSDKGLLGRAFSKSRQVLLG
jgi:hypothetical protein